MPNYNAGGQTVQSALNRMSPAAADAKLGDTLADLISTGNDNRARLNSFTMSSPGLVIKNASSPTVKAGTAFVANILGALVRKAANTDMPAISGVLATARSAAWVFFIDATGILSVSAKTADALTHDAALALLSATPSGVAMVGILVVDNASGSTFTAGTTNLDAAGITATYYNTIGANIGTTTTVKDLESRY